MDKEKTSKLHDAVAAAVAKLQGKIPDEHIKELVSHIATELSQSLDIDLAPEIFAIDKITVDLDAFQNRKKEYSEHSVNNIVKAVEDGVFDTKVCNPVLLWHNKTTDKYFVLSGHSRLEAFKRLQEKYPETMYTNHNARMGYYEKHEQNTRLLSFIQKYDWFKKAPVLVIDDIDKDQAKLIAYMSNALATKETDTERADIYRSFRSLGKTEKEIDEIGRKREKSNRSRIKDYSFLNPNGLIISTLEGFEENRDDSNIVKRVAKRIGHIRYKHPELSNVHEEELFEWLMFQGGYGTRKDQINNQNRFMDVVQKHLENIKIDNVFSSDQKLNVLKIQNLSDTMREYYGILTKLKMKKAEYRKKFDTIRSGLNKAQVGRKGTANMQEIDDFQKKMEALVNKPLGMTDAMDQMESLLFDVEKYVDEDNVEKIKKEMLAVMNALEQKYYAHVQKKGDYLEGSKAQKKMVL